MRKTVDFPEPLTPSKPILAPGKKLKLMSLMISRFGGMILLTPFMVYTYCMAVSALAFEVAKFA